MKDEEIKKIEYQAAGDDAWTLCTPTVHKALVQGKTPINLHIEGHHFLLYHRVSGDLDNADLIFKHCSEGTQKDKGAPRITFRYAPQKLVQLKVTDGGNEWEIDVSSPLSGEKLFDMQVAPSISWSGLLNEILDKFDPRPNGLLKVFGPDGRLLTYHGRTNIKTIMAPPPVPSAKRMRQIFKAD